MSNAEGILFSRVESFHTTTVLLHWIKMQSLHRFFFLFPKFLWQNPLQALEFAACIGAGPSLPKKQKQRFPLRHYCYQVPVFLASGPPRDYQSLLTDFNRDLFLIAELMSPINPLQRERVIPPRREKRLIWKSESVPEPYTFKWTNPIPGSSECPTTSLLSWGKQHTMGPAKPGVVINKDTDSPLKWEHTSWH